MICLDNESLDIVSRAVVAASLLSSALRAESDDSSVYDMLLPEMGRSGLFCLRCGRPWDADLLLTMPEP
jgi:hypothetical protein